ncbi:uncharacterized protein snapc2 [Fundulus diaphanus]
MKPPSRARTKRDWSLRATLPESQRKAGCKWGRADLKKLLHGLKTLNQATAGLEEIDCGLLKRHIPTRSISEINVMVDSLKRKAISSARFQMHMKNWEEKQARKSIEEWAHMTSALAGTLETVISAAFFQMLIVSSTEPCTLWNCDPYQDPGPTIGCTVPLKPVPRVVVKGEDPARVLPAMLPITSTPTMSGSRRFSAPSKVVKVQTSQALTPQKKSSPTAANPIPPAECSDTNALSVNPTGQTAQLLSNKVPASLSSSSHKPLTSSASDLSPVPTAAQSVVSSYGLPVSSFSSSHSTVPLSETAAVIHARFGQMSKHPTIQSPKKFGVKCVVDFEKIYKFLSVIQKPSEDCRLTPMESAIVLDLLISLPEELPYLDCKNLYTHLTQVYRCILAPVDSRPAKQLLSKLKNTNQAQREPPASQEPKLTCNQEAGSIGASNSSLDTGRGNTSLDQSEDSNLLDFSPSLNPLLVPLNLLMRRLHSE